jgi:excisionase family DNA binding protein
MTMAAAENDVNPLKPPVSPAAPRKGHRRALQAEVARGDVAATEPHQRCRQEKAIMRRTEAGVSGRKTAWPELPKARRIPDACRALGVCRSTLYKLAAQNKIKLVRIAGRTVVPESEIDRLASEGTA